MTRASFVLLAVVCIVWEAGTRYFHVPLYIFPPLSKVLSEIARNPAIFLRNTGITAFESILGAVLGCTVGLALGGMMAISQWAKSALLPYVIGSNAVPVVAIAPLVSLWFGHGTASKIIVAGFLCFFPIAINAYDGLRDKGGVYKELFFVLGSSREEYFWKLQVPTSLPFLVAGAKISAVLAVIGAVVAEFIGSDAGLGFGMVQATYSLNTPRLFGYMIVACVLGVMFYGAVLLVELTLRRSGRWIWAFGPR